MRARTVSLLRYNPTRRHDRPTSKEMRSRQRQEKEERGVLYPCVVTSSGLEAYRFNKNAGETSPETARNSSTSLGMTRNGTLTGNSVKSLHRIYDSTVRRFNVAKP